MRKHHCITNDLIKIAKVKPKLASIICEEATALGITYNSIPDIMSKVGHISNSLYAAQLVNNKPSKEPKTTAVPDKSYPESVLGDDYDSCVTNLSKLVTKDRAIEECKTQWKSVGSKTGSLKVRSAKICSDTKNYYSNICKNAGITHPDQDIQECISKLSKSNPKLSDNEIHRQCDTNLENKTQSDLNKNREPGKLASAQLTREKIMQRIRGKYPMLSVEKLKTIVDQAIQEEEQSQGKPKQASLQNSTPYWIKALNVDVSHLPPNTTNLKGASLADKVALLKQIEYYNSIGPSRISENIRDRTTQRNNQSRIYNAKLAQDHINSIPAWATCIGY
jgi:hypothetical protein